MSKHDIQVQGTRKCTFFIMNVDQMARCLLEANHYYAEIREELEDGSNLPELMKEVKDLASKISKERYANGKA